MEFNAPAVTAAFKNVAPGLTLEFSEHPATNDVGVRMRYRMEQNGLLSLDAGGPVILVSIEHQVTWMLTAMQRQAIHDLGLSQEMERQKEEAAAKAKREMTEAIAAYVQEQREEGGLTMGARAALSELRAWISDGMPT